MGSEGKMSKEVVVDKIIAEAHCDMGRWWKIFLLRCLLGMPFIIGSIWVYHKYGFGELAMASGVVVLPMCLFILETLRHLKDRVVFYPNAIVVNRKKVVLNKSVEEYFHVSEGTLGIWGGLYLGGKDVTYVENVRDLYFKTYMNYEEWVQGDKTAIHNALKRIIPAGEEYIPVYAFRTFRKRTAINYAVGITKDKMYFLPIYAGESLLGFKGYFIVEKKTIKGMHHVDLWGEHEINMHTGKHNFQNFQFIIKDVMDGIMKEIKNLPFKLNQEKEAAAAMEMIKEWEKTKGY